MSLGRIKERRDLIELEAFAANVESNHHRHEELKTILTQAPVRQVPSITLPCHCIGFQRNARFFGRASDLASLNQSLLQGASTSQQSISLVGLGGIGKTQLALEFAWQNVNTFQAILWAQADSARKLDQSFVQFSRKLGLSSDGDKRDDQQIVMEVVDWFCQACKWTS